MKTALITGITGQDGSYLTELLLGKGYTVHGLVRRQSSIDRRRLDHLYTEPHIRETRLKLHYAELMDTTRIRRLIHEIKPDELYHLAGQSHVGTSFEIPETTCELTAMATLRLLEILRDCEQPPRLMNMSSSEVFGRSSDASQNEETPFHPVSPYGIAKAFATDMVRLYRESYGLYATNAICYNHESPRRGESFVTRKITRATTRIREGLQDRLSLGNLDSRRDWGYAKDYVEAMWLMLQQEQPTDYVIATGQTHSIKQFLQLACEGVGLDWKDYVDVDARYMRPSEAGLLTGDPGKARQSLNWRPSTSFEDLVKIMIRSDWNLARNEKQQSQIPETTTTPQVVGKNPPLAHAG
jgi:GDPmannose 4,6-dehydratase